MLPCYDILASMCDTLYERAPMLSKMNHEIPSDMLTTLHTLLFASNRAGVEELATIGHSITKLYGKKLASQVEKDKKHVHEMVRENMNLTVPEEGCKVQRLMEIAREVNQPYTPSEKCLLAYKKYLQLKGNAGGEFLSPPSNPSDETRIPGAGGLSGIPVQPVMPRSGLSDLPYGNRKTNV
eukprot:TRINITY_DN12644_c0_g2_i1.p1 TRINITY_DN12644_c0_g2~~TRINITY_DN12644_c0_g2_i1.p1  ORF type:complete len:181 (+),score=44.41 TRINITY_DN12644_c0_g2_i1:370-912(+)